MAIILNERDWILSTAAVRLVPVAPPNEIVIPGYTGITLAKDISLFYGNYGSNTPWAIAPDRMVLTAQLKGIPANTPITWTTGRNVFLPGANTPVWQEGSNIILTETGDPLIRTIEASSYPKETTPYSAVPWGIVRVTVEWGGQVFMGEINVGTFTG